jgi:integrase
MRPACATKVEHHPALPVPAIGDFTARLRAAEGIGARALEFVVLTAARSGEVRGATRAEIDLEAAVWTVPANRMKAGRHDTAFPYPHPPWPY